MSGEEFVRYQIFAQFHNAQMMPSSSSATLAQTSNFTTCFTFVALRTWVIDSGASDKITGNKGILFTLNSLSLSLPVILTDGSTYYTKGVGTDNATPSLSLSFIFCLKIFI